MQDSAVHLEVQMPGGAVEEFLIDADALVGQVKAYIVDHSESLKGEKAARFQLECGGHTLLSSADFGTADPSVSALLERGEKVGLRLVRKGREAAEDSGSIDNSSYVDEAFGSSLSVIPIPDEVDDLQWMGDLCREMAAIFDEMQALQRGAKESDLPKLISDKKSIPYAAVREPLQTLSGLISDVQFEQSDLDALYKMRVPSSQRRTSFSGARAAAPSYKPMAQARPPPSHPLGKPNRLMMQRRDTLSLDFMSFIMEEEIGIKELCSSDSLGGEQRKEDFRGRRRGSVFGVLNRGNKPLIAEKEGWRLELGHEDIAQVTTEELAIERADNEKGLYQQYFVDHEHENFVGEVQDIGPVSISCIEESDADGKPFIRALIRTKFGEQMKVIDASQVRRKFLKKKRETQTLLQAVSPMFSFANTADRKVAVRRVKQEKIVDELKDIEQKQLVNAFKFGVLYRKRGQTTENEMFQNTTTSAAFEEFLSLLGDRVELLGFKGFRGGLDVKNGTTGSHSVYRKWNNYEIMFHVAPMLPFYAKDEQQLEKKRHLGNDIVMIVFQEGDEPWVPGTVKSEFIHVIFVVSIDQTLTQERGETYYRIAMACKDKMPIFGPMLPADPVFTGKEMVKLLFTKLINSELAAYRAPAFVKKFQLTRNRYLDYLSKQFKKGD